MSKTEKKKRVVVVPHGNPLQVGNTVLIRTVTAYQTGRIIEIGEHEIVLEEAAWVADTGRFELALSTGELAEVEPLLDGCCAVGRGAIVDVWPWAHALPRKVQ